MLDPAFAGMTNTRVVPFIHRALTRATLRSMLSFIVIHGLFDHNTTATVSPACRAIIAASHRVKAQGTRLTGPANHRTGIRKAARR
jgi:hypothetical protein